VSPYSSWATAATNIQHAVDAAYVGATVLVSNGVYQTGGRIVYGSMSNRVAVTKPLAVRSVNGSDVTVIQGYRAPGTNTDSNVRCVYLASGAALVGFTLTNGATRGSGDFYRERSGGGVCFDGPTGGVVSNCALAGNSASGGGGGVMWGTLYNCKLTGNSAVLGGGAYDSTLYNCIVTTNTADTNSPGTSSSIGGGVYLGKLLNCIVAGNWAREAGGVANATLTNCTVVGNAAIFWGGGGSSSTFRNCVLYYNTAANGANNSGGNLAYCCTTPLTSGTGNFTNAPIFMDLAGGDLRLQSNSPCINAGNNAYVSGANDLDGNARVVGGTVDVGAYEYQAPGSILPYVWAQQYGLATDGSADFADADSDGMNNWQEWIAGVNPTNAASVLALLRPARTNNLGGITLTWQSVNTRTYYLESSTNISASPPFTSIKSNIVGQTGTTSVTDATATNAGPYFYRIGVQ
jgi:hypothetical protein